MEIHARRHFRTATGRSAHDGVSGRNWSPAFASPRRSSATRCQAGAISEAIEARQPPWPEKGPSSRRDGPWSSWGRREAGSTRKDVRARPSPGPRSQRQGARHALGAPPEPQDQKGRAYGVVTAKALAVLEALLWGFHNARSGVCFPSYERIARPPAAPGRLSRRP